MWFLEPEQLFIMPPAASPATSLLSLFILTFLHRPSTSCCHTERSRTGNAAHYPETNACYTTKVTQLPLLCDLIHAKLLREKNDFCKKKVVKGRFAVQCCNRKHRENQQQPFTHITFVVRLPWIDYVQFGHNYHVSTAPFVEVEVLQ